MKDVQTDSTKYPVFSFLNHRGIWRLRCGCCLEFGCYMLKQPEIKCLTLELPSANYSGDYPNRG